MKRYVQVQHHDDANITGRRQNRRRYCVILLALLLLLYNFEFIRAKIFISTYPVQLSISQYVENKTKTKTTAFHYHHKPADFVETVVECIKDDECGILYHHVPKSGGSTMQHVFKGLNYKMRYYSSCCIEFDLVMGRSTESRSIFNHFKEDPSKYCARKFQGYEVYGGQFGTVVITCMNIVSTSSSSKNTRNKDDGNTDEKEEQQKEEKGRRRFITLSSYREPMSRTISWIEQACNKGLEKRPKKVVQACSRCRYEGEDKIIWDGFANDTLKTFRHLDYVNRKLKSDVDKKNDESVSKENNDTTAVAKSVIVPVDVLMINLDDMDDFFVKLNETLTAEEQESETNPYKNSLKLDNTHVNKKKKGNCNFGMTSSMMKMLMPASDVYHNFIMPF